MLKRLILSLAFAGLISPAFAAGTLPGISMSQQLDSSGNPLSGGKLYLIQAGTTSTPQNCYQDSGLTPALAWPNPITLDSAGRIPQLFCADGSIKIRLTNSAGVTQLVADGLLVVGPSGGGGGGSSVDPTTILATGDFKLVYNTGVLSGFVRCNGRTIGSATSGATERANADTSALFSFLWNADPNLSVSGGRGVSAAADFAANKTITLPDCRGRGIAGLDDMGNSAASRLTSTWFGSDATVLGAANGKEKSALSSLTQLPQFTPSGTNSVPIINGGTTELVYPNGSGFGVVQSGSGATVPNPGSFTALSLSAPIFTGNPVGQASPNSFASVGPTIVMTIYIKL
jgi:hypothetical protein